MELLWDWGTKVCSNGPGHLTKMVKTLKNLLLWNQKANDLGLHNRVLEYYQVCPNDDPGLILVYSMARSNLVPYVFVWEKVKQCFFFFFFFFFFQKLLSSRI